MLSSIFSSTVQTEVRSSIQVNYAHLIQLVKKAISGEAVTYMWMGKSVTKPVDSDMLRHKATNYDSLTHTDWYINLKKTYGEAIHLLLKSFINNQINTYILQAMGQELTSVTRKGREVIENLHAEIESLHFEIDQLHSLIKEMKSEADQQAQKMEELEIKNFDLEVKIHNTEKQAIEFADKFTTFFNSKLNEVNLLAASNLEKLKSESQRTLEAANLLAASNLEALKSESQRTLEDVKEGYEEVTFNLSQSLSNTQEALSNTQEALSNTQEALSNTQKALIITEKKLEITEKKLEVTQRTLAEVQEDVRQLKESLGTYRNKNWALGITKDNVSEAREIMGNGIRDTYIITSELSQQTEVATVEEAPTLLDTVGEVENLVGEMTGFMEGMKEFTSIETEVKLLDSLGLQCYKMQRKLTQLTSQAANLKQHLKANYSSGNEPFSSN